MVKSIQGAVTVSWQGTDYNMTFVTYSTDWYKILIIVTFLTLLLDFCHEIVNPSFLSCIAFYFIEIQIDFNMGNNKNSNDKSRRDFFSLLVSKKETEKIKMLTPDGKLVEVDKAVFEQVSGRKKATNEEILNWMENPSKQDK